jgi:hypothetical protein
MFWLLFACAGGGPKGEAGLDCETVYQTVDSETPGDTPAGYEYCAEDDDGLGAFNRVSAEECTDGGGFCATDADCDSDEVCLCGGGVAVNDGEGWRGLTVLSQCVGASCTGPDDCDGYGCGLTFDASGGALALFCRTPQDTCRTDADCSVTDYCFYTGEKWACEPRSPSR